MIGPIPACAANIEIAEYANKLVCRALGRPANRMPAEMPAGPRMDGTKDILESGLRAAASQLDMPTSAMQRWLEQTEASEGARGWTAVIARSSMVVEAIGRSRAAEAAGAAEMQWRGKRAEPGSVREAEARGLEEIMKKAADDHRRAPHPHPSCTMGGRGGGGGSGSGSVHGSNRSGGGGAGRVAAGRDGRGGGGGGSDTSSDSSMSGRHGKSSGGAAGSGRSGRRRKAHSESDEWSDSEDEAEDEEMYDDLGVAVRSKSKGRGGLKVYVRSDGDGTLRKNSDEAVQANAFHAAAKKIAGSKKLRERLSRVRSVALGHETEERLFEEYSSAVKSHQALAVALMANEVSEPRGASSDSVPYLSKVVSVVRVVQAEVLLAVTRELREIMGYDAAVDGLAKAIMLGRWNGLDFKSLAAAESHGAWVGKMQPDLPDWSTQTGLFQSIWTPLVCVYTALHRYDPSAHRVLTLVSTETQNAIRVGIPTGEAVAGLIVKFFAMVEEEMRALQRGTRETVSLRGVWEKCQTKPFYKSFALQSAANNMREGSYLSKLMKRVSSLEAGKRVGASGGGGAGPSGAGAGPAQAGGAQGGRVKSEYIDGKELGRWQDANPGKCFYHHLKGGCRHGGDSCPRGTH